MSTRRDFLRQALATSLAFGGLQAMFSADGLAALAQPASLPLGFGPLVKDPAGLFDLPAGFKYVVFSRTGESMQDGLLVPARHDGMAAFAGPEPHLTLLVRNHESHVHPDDPGPFGPQLEHLGKLERSRIYDFGRGQGICVGGTTTLLFDIRRQQLVSHHLSLAGTYRNCAGGPTPWGSWLTGEETVIRPAADNTLERDHGYVFEVPARADGGLVDPVPLKAMGRFVHEALAVDPRSGAVYLTEDTHDGLLYRFLPRVKGKLAEGGRLQALVIKDQPSLNTSNWAIDAGGPGPVVAIGQPLAVQWIDLDNVDAPENDLRLRGFEAGAARFTRGEGMWYAHGVVYFACTEGGPERVGQIWKYTPSAAEGTPEEDAAPGQLELVVEPNDRAVLDMGDNLTVAPWGDLIVCEDGGDDNYLVGVTPAGKLYQFARNSLNGSELCGATFSPDGSTLFVNIQSPGMTLAITGPWRRV